jgi:5,10-methylenetetrahydrofolate reductase
MDTWIDLNHSIRNLALNDVFVFLTDDAVGSREEENLAHLASNVGSDVPLSRLIPFLTCKHTLEYCLTYADRAHSLGFKAITVVGGDTSLGPPRCVPHAYLLREQIRKRQPTLSLGGWANPHRDIAMQVEYLSADHVSADFYLTQVVSHHSVDRVAAFLEECDKRNVEIPGVFGVFYYWSAQPKTLGMLKNFFPVPVEELTREFDAGVTPEEVMARTLKALRAAGADKVYVSNLGHRRVQDRLTEVLERSCT